jgi:hypothetical protein
VVGVTYFDQVGRSLGKMIFKGKTSNIRRSNIEKDGPT